MSEKNRRCPRLGNEPEESSFYEGHGLANSFAPGCGGCGSISGDEFMKFVREGGEVGGSDKNYKVYLDKDTGTPSEMITESTGHGSRSYVKQGTGVQHAKFYFQHLTRAQQQEFVDLWNAGKVKHSLYVMPYFMEAVK